VPQALLDYLEPQEQLVFKELLVLPAFKELLVLRVSMVQQVPQAFKELLEQLVFKELLELLV
jgi:hypothetical protein